MPTLLITAVPFETDKVKIAHNFEEQNFSYIPYFGNSVKHQNKLVLGEVGLGMANACSALAIIASQIKPKKIICLGIAGAIRPDLNIGDIILADRIFQHDSFRSSSSNKIHYLRPGISSLKKENHVDPTIELNKDFIISIEKILSHQRIYKGTLASGSELMCSSTRKKELFLHRKDIIGIDMESCGLAKVAENLSIPLVVIKVISDTMEPKKETIFGELINQMEISTNVLTAITKIIIENFESTYENTY